LTAIAGAVEVNSRYLIEIQYSAPFLSQRKQKQDEADGGQNHCGGEARGCDFGPGMVVLFKVPSEADQETKKANAEHNQSDRSLIVVRDFHGFSNQI
jgi:hypothetical protein